MGTLRVATIVGARPQFIKAAPVSSALRARGIVETLVHTGQHYNDELSAVFFREMQIPEPTFNLEVGSGPHGRQTGEMLRKIEAILEQVHPDIVLVYGDTNSTLAGALAAAKLRIPIHHVEAGLRSFNRDMPEEHNRVLTDHCSDVLYCPTGTAVRNLATEGIVQGVFCVGDTMLDALNRFLPVARKNSKVMSTLKIEPRGYVLATLHRPSNVDNPDTLQRICESLDRLNRPVVFPMHPRTHQALAALAGDRRVSWRNILLLPPLGYLDMLSLEDGAALIVTDSGGVQKEAYMLGVACVTLRTETEWVETVEAGWNVLADPSTAEIAGAIQSLRTQARPDLFGDGRASERIVDRIAACIA
jgi:UDP-GlcNAc3NAcA epimerase